MARRKKFFGLTFVGFEPASAVLLAGINTLFVTLQIVNEKRSVGVGGNPPHVTVLVPLHESVDVSSLSESIQNCVLADEAVISTSPLIFAGYTANIPRLRHRFQVRPPSDILVCFTIFAF